MVKFQRTWVSGQLFVLYHLIILENVYLWKNGSALWLLLMHWVNAALIPWSVGIDIWPTWHFREQCNPSSIGLHNFSFPYLLWTPGLLTWSLMWSQCLAKTMTKLERNTLGTDLWPWCVTVLCSKEQSDSPIALVSSSQKAQAVFALNIQACSCLCLRWVFHTVWFVTDSCCASTSSAIRVIALFTIVLWLPIILVGWVLEAGELPAPAFLQSWASCTFFASPPLTGLICGW